MSQPSAFSKKANQSKPKKIKKQEAFAPLQPLPEILQEKIEAKQPPEKIIQSDYSVMSEPSLENPLGSSFQKTSELLQLMSSRFLLGGSDETQDCWISLKNEILGGIHIQLALVGKKLRLLFLVSSVEAQKKIETNASQLLTQLGKKGLEVESFVVQIGESPF